jgi:hypothetical protein
MVERTTVRLPDELMARAKRKAVVEGRTLTSLIEEGLRLVTAETRTSQPGKRISPRVSKAKGGLLPGIDLTSFSAFEESEDLAFTASPKRPR